ncbi:MAG: DedA family protein [Pseudonocardiaceae bacterium]|nr:DedA family protein [Pseudonocardiaceae bacterium]
MPSSLIAVPLAFGPLESAGPSTIWAIVTTFVFVECALVVGMFLPGDTLLLGAGVVLATQYGGTAHVWTLTGVATVLAVAGNHAGYLLGRRTGTRVWAREGGRVLNRHNLERAHLFLERWGFWGVVVARWIPWVRTLAPLIAGAARMPPRRFLVASTLGALAWVPTLLLLGFYAAGLIERAQWLEPVITGSVIVLFTVTVVLGLWRYRQDMRKPVDTRSSLPDGDRAPV